MAGLKRIGKKPSKCKVIVLGTAYKGDVDDSRDSPSKIIISTLQKRHVPVVVHDPICSECFGAEDALGLGEKIKLIGFVPDSHVKYWLNSADIFALASLSETGPVVMYEALGSGIPFVGTSTGAVPEVITSQQYGLVCHPKDVDSLADNILTAIDMHWNSNRIKCYAERYTWDNIAKALVKIYNGILISSNSDLAAESTKNSKEIK